MVVESDSSACNSESESESESESASESESESSSGSEFKAEFEFKTSSFESESSLTTSSMPSSSFPLWRSLSELEWELFEAGEVSITSYSASAKELPLLSVALCVDAINGNDSRCLIRTLKV